MSHKANDEWMESQYEAKQERRREAIKLYNEVRQYEPMKSTSDLRKENLDDIEYQNSIEIDYNQNSNN